MTIFIKLSTGEYPRHQGDVRLEYPDMGDEFVLPETYAQVRYVNPPTYDYTLQRAEETPPILVAGEWIMQWNIRQATQFEIELAESQRNL